MVRGAEWRDTMKECTSARSILRERGRERALLRAMAKTGGSKGPAPLTSLYIEANMYVIITQLLLKKV